MEIIDNSTTENNEESPGKTPRPKWGVVLVWVFVLGLLAVLGIGLVRSQRGSIRVGDRVPNLVLSTFDGDEIDFADLRGQIIVVNFWASWCKPCEQDLGLLTRMVPIWGPGSHRRSALSVYQKHTSSVQMVGWQL